MVSYIGKWEPSQEAEELINEFNRIASIGLVENNYKITSFVKWKYRELDKMNKQYVAQAVVGMRRMVLFMSLMEQEKFTKNQSLWIKINALWGKIKEK